MVASIISCDVTSESALVKGAKEVSVGNLYPWPRCSKGEIVFSADQNCVRYCNNDNPEWIKFDLSGGTIVAGYINPEEPYIAEMLEFVNAITQNNKRLYSNTLLDDYRLLQTLYKLEKLAEITQ